MAFSPILSVTMNRSSLYRLTKPMMNASLIGMLNRWYHSDLYRPYIPDVEEDDLSIIDPYLIPKLDTNENASYEILGSGVILLKDYLSLMAKVDIVYTCERLGLGPGGFYQPRNQYGHALKLQMMSLGRNWDPVTGYGKSCTSDGSKPPPPLPLQFVDLAKCAIKDAQSHLHELPSMCPDVCVVNFYPPGGRLGLHQDRDESSDSLSSGLPVVSMSLGNTAEFWYGETRDMNKLGRVMLECGDVLIFGGKSRLIFHGVRKTIPNTCSLPLAYATRLTPGRLNLTLRQF